ncbi:MAG: hypothetical protein ACJAU3_001394 [Zhongshania sp.]|jgi:hypothetical protein
MVLRGVRKVLGRNISARLARGLLAKDVARQVVVYRKEIAALPCDRAIEIDYTSLVADPVATMQKLQGLLDLTVINNAPSNELKQRTQLNPVLQGYEQALQHLIDTHDGSS